MEFLYPLLYCGSVLALSFLFESKFGEEPSAAEGDSDINRLSGKERELFDVDEEIRRLAKEAQKVNHPDSFVEHSKLQRQVLKLEKQRDKLKLEVAQQKEALGGAEEVSHKQVREKFREIKAREPCGRQRLRVFSPRVRFRLLRVKDVECTNLHGVD